MKRILFVTGTDTGVGKTVVTVLLLRFLREHGVAALAMKPFCTGDRGDVEQLQAAQNAELPDDWVNPFFFPVPVAPLVAARNAGRRISMAQTLGKIQRLGERGDVLLVEGAGGLLSPLGAEFFTAADIIAQLRCDVLVVARNRLGTLNHTALVVRVLSRIRGVGRIQVALSDSGAADESTASNAKVLRRWLRPLGVSEVPFLGEFQGEKSSGERAERKLKKVLATILQSYIFSSLFRMDSRTRRTM